MVIKQMSETKEERESRKFAPWTFQEGVDFVRDINSHLQKANCHAGITGSVLYKGYSAKDLDLIIYPRDATKTSRSMAHENLIEAGLTHWIPTSTVHETWRSKGSSDDKQVDIWITSDNHRVDIFWLGFQTLLSRLTKK